MVMLLALPILVPEMVTLILYHWAGLKLSIFFFKSKVTSVFVSASPSFFVVFNPHCSYPLCNSLISNIRIF